MEDGNTNSLGELCTRIGCLMEDASVDALTIGSMIAADQQSAMKRLGKAIDEMQALLKRAQALRD